MLNYEIISPKELKDNFRHYANETEKKDIIIKRKNDNKSVILISKDRYNLMSVKDVNTIISPKKIKTEFKYHADMTEDTDIIIHSKKYPEGDVFLISSDRYTELRNFDRNNSKSE